MRIESRKAMGQPSVVFIMDSKEESAIIDQMIGAIFPIQITGKVDVGDDGMGEHYVQIWHPQRHPPFNPEHPKRRPKLCLLLASGSIMTIDRAAGQAVADLSGPWTEILPKIVANDNHEEEFDFGIGVDGMTVNMPGKLIKVLWLSICRDEELIEKAGKVVTDFYKVNQRDLPISLHNAINALHTSLKMRGRCF